MTKSALRTFLLFFTAFGLVACEEPKQAPEVKVEGLELKDAPVPPSLVSGNPGKASVDDPESGELARTESGNDESQEGSDVPDDAVDSEDDVEAEPEVIEPELRVYRKDDTIVVEGALQSRVQVNRIKDQLGVAFSGTRIESTLVRDYDRFPVGWGNRVTEGFLIPYLRDVQDPYVGYKEGIISLRGKATGTQERAFQQLAGIIFSGPLSRDIDNQIEIIDGSREGSADKSKAKEPEKLPADFPVILE